MNLPPRRHSPFFTYALALLILGALYRTPTAEAGTVARRANELKVSTTQTIRLFDGKFNNGASVAAADVTGDGVDEYIVGPGDTGGPRIEVYKQNGDKVAQFFAYDKKMTTGINVAAGDIDGDGVAEIVVGPQPGFKPEVRVFNVQGKLLGSFNAFESSYTGGVYVAVLPYRDGQVGRVVVGSGVGRESEVRTFTWPNKIQSSSWLPYSRGFGNGIPVATEWSDVYGQPVIVIGNGAGYNTKIQVYGLTSGSLLSSWIAFDSKLRTGVNVAVRGDVIAAATGPGGGPEIRIFSMTGVMTNSYSAYEPNFRGGVLLALTPINGLMTGVTVPTVQPTSAAATGKSIVVSLSKQRLYQYQFGNLIGVHVISSGKWSTPTPTGQFKTKNKIPNAYSKPFNLYMQWWMAITPDGKVGLHALPYWKLRNGGKLYEGLAHLGTPVSHGCIRQGITEAKTLYDWAPIGTPVTVLK